MEKQKVANLLGDADGESSKCATRKWYVINEQKTTDYAEGRGSATTVKFETQVV